MKATNYDNSDLYQEYVYVENYGDEPINAEDDKEEILAPPEQVKKKTRNGFELPNVKYGPLILTALGVAAVIAVVGIVAGTSMRSKIYSLSAVNSEMTQQMAAMRKNVYVAKRDIPMGTNIVYSGPEANVEMTQINTSSDASLYITTEQSGMAQIDITRGTPVTKSMVGKNDPTERLEPEHIVEQVEVPEHIVIPYKITADYIDEESGDSIQESMELQLEPGISEKTFDMRESNIDDYELTSVTINNEPVYSYGALKTELRNGNVTLYYYTSEEGTKRTEIKENVHVVYKYKYHEESTEEEPVEEPVEEPEEEYVPPAEDDAITYEEIQRQLGGE